MLHKYHVMYSVGYFPRFHVTAVGLGNVLPANTGGPHAFNFQTTLFKRGQDPPHQKSIAFEKVRTSPQFVLLIRPAR